MSTIRLRATIIGVATLTCLCLGAIIDPRTTLAAYLVGWITLAAIPIGGLLILPTTYLVRRTWTHDLPPILAAMTATLPLCGVLFIPVLLRQSLLYPVAAGAAAPAFRAAYLAPWAFALRTIAYFSIWFVLGAWLTRAWGDSARMNRAASATLIVASLTISLAGIDWLESLNADFHSSIYGLLFVSFTLMSSLAFVLAFGLRSYRRIHSTRGYGGLFLGTLLLWAYLHAMQYIVIWAGNIPDEVTWYLDRAQNGWQYVTALLAIGQFVVPFLLLLSARVRRDRRWLFAICTATLILRGAEAALLAFPEIDNLNVMLLPFANIAALLFIASAFTLVITRKLGDTAVGLNAPAARA
ncbi:MULTISPECIES: hypothetical protein [unclassified Nitrobacter]|uniref:hypothetical protein n=1 Tax=unclassified Nitrobacter TaxID=2620411 RepID=UPI00092BAD2A|nr:MULTISPECIES: hypothetical protein [unclassified Nitrobacter]MBN9147968.1 hypothetical protein [Nitrobacter sp.]MBN9489869.1 hypothetical protein [Alphaproteobacteria bacterium]OJV01457.1 MAG: hypothetical protein BGO16_12960 [Nitrobacter sp. 62-23]